MNTWDMVQKSLMFAVLACLIFPRQVAAMQTDNHGIHAVPVPGKIVIDGDLSDWDLSGQVLMCYDVDSLRDTYSAQVAMMYDADNFYVGIHWKAPRPMSNHHDPHYQAGKGWAADSVQLRVMTDEISHVTAWYYVDAKQPTIHIEHGKSLTEPMGGGTVVLYQTEGWALSQGAEMAFRMDADGHGYVQEMKLPWKLITLQKIPGAGDTMHCGVELLWGSADWPEMRYADNLAPGASSREFFWTSYNNWGPVFLEPKGHLHLPTPAWMTKTPQSRVEQAPIPIAYSLPVDSLATLAIDDDYGNRVRNLVAAAPRKKGHRVEYWDGLDDAGIPVPPGTYHFKVLYHDPIHVNWALSYANPGSPTWSTPDGRGAFYGDHSAPHAVATAGRYAAMACPIGEAGQPLIGCDLSGQRLWGQANREFARFGIMSLATDGKTLWIGSDGNPPIVYRVDIATGRYSPWNKTAVDPSSGPYRVLDLPVGSPASTDEPTKQASTASPPAPSGPGLSAIAYRDGVLAVCLPKEGVVKLLDAETGDVKRTIPADAPRSAVLTFDGSVIVLTGQGSLLHIAPGGETTAFAADSYADGQSITSDSHGNLYLSVRGNDQNVKVFGPDGKIVREIGKLGGRPSSGPYDPAAMLNPAQIAVDSLDRLWVTEENMNPKRTSVWDTVTGQLLHELVGTTTYCGAGALNPFDPTMGFSTGTVYKLDWRQGTYSPVYSVAGSGDPADLFPPGILGLTNRVVPHDSDWMVFTNDGAWKTTQCTLCRNGRWQSAAAVGIVLDENELQHNIYASESVRQKFANPIFAGHVGEAYAWADLNGDGLVQPDEIHFAPIMAGASIASGAGHAKPDSQRPQPQNIGLDTTGWGQLPQPDGTLVYFSVKGQAIVKFPITGYTPCGAPVYDVAHPQIIRVDRPLLERGEGMIAGGAGGVVYCNQNPLLAVGPAGHVLWTYPSPVVGVHGSHNAKSARPGYLIGPNSILGTADLGRGVGEVFDMNGNLGENVSSQ